MAKLLFQNSLGIERWIADCDTWDEVCYYINEFIKQANANKLKNQKFTSYYKRYWEEDGRIKIDVGSWSEFFYWENKIEAITGEKDEQRV